MQMYFISLAVQGFRYSVFRVATSDLSAHSITRIVMKGIVACYAYDFNVVLLIYDGAPEHRAFQNAMGQYSIAEVMAMIETEEMEDDDTDMLGLLFGRVGGDAEPEPGDGLPQHSDLKIAFRHPVDP